MPTQHRLAGRRQSGRRRSPAPVPAKLAPPRLTRVYPRARLFSLLNKAYAHADIVWIEGPPGAGKSTLAASYIGERRSRSLWYRIDSGDADSATFFHYLAMGATLATPRHRVPLPRLAPEQLADLPVFARRFFESLYARLKTPAILVFDNYHELPADAPLHALLAEGLALLPEGVRVIVLSRSGPPAALARLRVHGSVAVLGESELRVTAPEARAIAGLRAGRTAPPPLDERIQRLLSQTRGWLAGLIVLLEGSEAEQASANTVAGENRQLLFNYFAREVYEHTDRAARAVLIRIAVLPEVTSKIAQRLTQSNEARNVLQALHRRNFFVAFQERGDTYELHPLFRAFLLERLQQELPAAEVASLRHRAGALLEKAGMIEAAIDLYRLATDWNSAARLILAAAPQLAQQARFHTIAVWLGQLPGEVLKSEPWLVYWHGMCRMALDPRSARDDFAQAYAEFDRRGDAMGMYLTWAAVIESIQIEWADFNPADPWIAAFGRLRARFPEFPTPQVEVAVVGAIVSALTNRNLNHPALSEWLVRADRLMQEADPSQPPAWWEAHLLWYYLWMGWPERAAAAVRRFEAIADESHMSPLVRLLWRTALSTYHWYFGNPLSSSRLIEDGLAIAERHGLSYWVIPLLGQGVYASLARGAPRNARRYLDQMRALIGARGPLHVSFYHHLCAMTAAHESDLASAQAHVDSELSAVRRSGLQFGIASAVCVQTNVALLARNGERAAAFLTELRDLREQTGSRLIALWHGYADTLATLGEGDSRAALTKLRDVLALSRATRGPGMPWLPHSALAEMYGLALRHGIEVEHVQTLIRRFGVAAPTSEASVDGWPYRVRIQTLGPFRVLCDDKPLTFRTKAQRKPLELLKALIALGGRDVREEQLGELLWPDAEADAAAHALATALYRLRKLIGEDSIVRQDGRLGANPERCWLDTWALERLFTAVEREQAPQQLFSLCEHALALYRGAFLEREADTAWVLPMRERLRARLLRHLEAAARRLAGAGGDEQAILCYRRALEIEPLAEPLYRGLMQSYLARGRPGDALSTYRRCCRALEAELGVEPAPETQALARAIPRAPGV